MKLYIAVLDTFPDYMVPTLVAHSVLGMHLRMQEKQNGEAFDAYYAWLVHSYKKCVVRVNQKEFDKISKLPDVYLGYEKNTLNGQSACAIPVPCQNDQLPNVLKFAKLWKPLRIGSKMVNAQDCKSLRYQFESDPILQYLSKTKQQIHIYISNTSNKVVDFSSTLLYYCNHAQK